MNEHGVSGVLLETNVTVISNDECKTILAANSSLDVSGRMKRDLARALANGINYGLLCTQGNAKLYSKYRLNYKVYYP